MYFFIFASYNIFHWIHLLRRISVVLSSVTYRLFSRFYLMFVTIFTATLVRILCGGIYRHFTTFYFAFAAAFNAALVCIFSDGIYCHFSQFYWHSVAVFTDALTSCFISCHRSTLCFSLTTDHISQILWLYSIGHNYLSCSRHDNLMQHVLQVLKIFLFVFLVCCALWMYVL